MVTFRASRKIRFQLDDGTTLDGVQVRRTRDYYIVEAASEVVDEATNVGLGLVEVPRRRVVYRQVLAP